MMILDLANYCLNEGLAVFRITKLTLTTSNFPAMLYITFYRLYLALRDDSVSNNNNIAQFPALRTQCKRREVYAHNASNARSKTGLKTLHYVRCVHCLKLCVACIA